MSYVLIDAGNSCLKIARVLELDNNDIKNDISYNIIDYTDLYEDLFYELEDYTPSKVLVCNVSNPLNFHIISDVIYKLWQIEAHLVHVEQDKYGLTTLYSNPRTLGADRWVGMIAAREEFKKTLCVVDCGTAVTIDVVTDIGVHLGGLITPGIKTARDSLGLNANNLPSVENNSKNINNNESSFLATNTQDAILGGTLYQLSAYIERIVSEIKEEFGEGVECIITGGDAEKIQALTYHHFHYREALILAGLKIVAREKFCRDSI